MVIGIFPTEIVANGNFAKLLNEIEVLFHYGLLDVGKLKLNECYDQLNDC